VDHRSGGRRTKVRARSCGTSDRFDPSTSELRDF